MSTHHKPVAKALTRWAIPGVAALIGLVYLVAGVLGDDLSFGIFGLALMLATGVVFVVLSRWSETAARLRDRSDERIVHLDRSASLIAGMVVLLAVLVMSVVEIAQGKDGSPYHALGALGGASYLVALIALRLWR